MLPKQLLLCVFALLVFSGTAFGRGGGGCFLPDTLIKTTHGEKPISALSPGEEIVSFDGSKQATAKVISVFEIETDSFFEIKTASTTVKVTGEHPIAIGNGGFKEAKRLSQGEEIIVSANGGLESERIESITLHSQKTKAFNLLVDKTNLFLANNVLVHNKGCFLPDTPIVLASGETRQISEVKVGDRLKAFSADGKIFDATVEEIFEITADGYFVIHTTSHEVKVTAEHPFFVGEGTFKTADALLPGEEIFAFDGAGLSKEKIVSKEFFKENISAFNLRTGWPDTFFANFIAVHNKGGGCFAAGTKVLTPSGEKNIEAISAGETVLGVSPGGAIKPVKVLQAFKTTDKILRIRTLQRAVDTTAEHPFLTAQLEFKKAGALSIGDSIIVFDGMRLREEKIISKEAFGEQEVFNLQVEAPDTFIANGFVVHNKGGGSSSSSPYTSSVVCGKQTSVITDNGLELQGFECYYFYYYKTNATLIDTFSSCIKGIERAWDNPACTISSGLYISSEQRFKCVKQEDCDKLPDSIVLQNGKKVKVIKTDWLGIILIGGFVLVWCTFFFGGIIFSIKRGLNPSGDLDYCYPAAQVDAKAQKTGKLLAYLAGIDKAWNAEQLKQIARGTFLKLQECWQSREYSPMQQLLMPDLYNQHLGQIDSLKRNHEIDKMDNIEIKRLEIVNVRYSAKREQQEFTVLFEASMRDYYIDDRTNEFLRGDSSPATFQEFYVFQRSGNSWLLREIDQTRESNALRAENFVEELTPEQLKNIYGALAAAPKAEKASWLQEEIAAKGDRVYRLLNFLSSTDKSWDIDFIKERARKIFIAVFGALEARDISGIEQMLLQPALGKYSGTIEAMKKDSRTVEFRNICVRKVDIVLVKNYGGNDKDEFTARISAHAQRVETKGGKTTYRDEYVSPFEEYWTFQRQKGEWKLKETQEPFNAAAILKMENIDEESSKEQVQWYYTKDRAL